ncbi:tetratricopeptide repeat protein [Actinomadura graeca]|uniref:Tetratricopeptide repeat protein n=1 Tax=Actinomadura graeca TaxID=2750812 RepID=A0ABX8R7B6_9ACTN|nr:tetratricopeptide repeat protein [Actinomadura graeca]QXJ25837.1 tetratricopeptide repeat protein [Actinomadura graeca]
MGLFVGRSEEQDRFRLVLAEAAARGRGGPDEAYVVLVQGYGGIGKSTLLRRFIDIAAGGLPEVSAGRFTVFLVDWERDRELHAEEYVEFAGPPIWRILERIRTQIENSAASWGPLERRRLKGFAAFQRQVTKLPELEADATRLGLGKQAAHRPLTPVQLAAIVRSGGEIAKVSGAPAAIVGAANTVAGAGAQIATTFQQNRAVQIDPAAYRALVDQIDALVTAFTDGLRALARRRPVVVVLDTCELLGASGPWLREVMRRSGRRVVWVIGTRLEPDFVAAGDSEAVRYKREIDQQRLRTMTLHRFDDRTAADYLQRRLGSLPPGLDLERVIALTQGVPLALHLMYRMLADQIRVGRPFDGLYDEVSAEGTVSAVVARMADRYLHHATYDPGSDLHQDLTALYGLALVNVEQTPARPRAFPPRSLGDRWEPVRQDTDTAVTIDRDPDLLAALWGIEVHDVAARLDELGRHHDFVHSGTGTLHRDVRDAIRTFLLSPKHRATVTDINTRAADHLIQQLSAHQHTGIDDQLTDATWRTTTAALLWHTCWINPADGIPLLRHLYLPARVLQPSYAQLLLDITATFAPYLTATDQKLLTHLTDLDSRSPQRQAARAAIDALTTAPTPQPPLLHGDTQPYLDLLRAETAPALDLDLADQVIHLRRAARAFPSGSGPTATKLGDIAQSCTLTTPNTQPTRLQKALIDAKKLATRYHPADATAHMNLGSALWELGRFAEAETAERKAIELDPDNAIAHNNFGITLVDLGRFAEAEIVYRKAIELDPDNAVVHTNVGNMLVELGRFAEAEIVYRKAIELDPDNAVVHNGLGNVLVDLGRFAEAEIVYRKAIELDPDNAVVHTNVGNVLVELGRFAEAEIVYRKAIELDPDNAVVHTNVGNVLVELGRFAEAEIVYRKAIELDPDNVNAHNGLGNVLLELGRFAEAEIVYRKAIELDPDNAVVHTNVGNVLVELGRFAEAEIVYRKAIELDPDNVNAHNGLGNVLVELGRFAEAEIVYRKAIELDPDNAVVHTNVGNVLVELGRFAEAEIVYRKAIELDPDNVNAHNGLGNVLVELGRFAEAETAFRKAIELDPDNVNAHNGLGNVLLELGRFAEAETAFRKAIELDPDNAIVHNSLGITLVELERFAETETAFRKAIELDRDYTSAYGWLGRFLLFTGELERARLGLKQADGRPRTELLRWIVARVNSQDGASMHTPDSVLAAFADPWPPRIVRPSMFAVAEIRALAVAGNGNGPQAVEILRSAMDGRRPRDRFVRPLYDLLTRPEPVAGLEGLLEVWREIIAADPSAAGPWGGPDPA